MKNITVKVVAMNKAIVEVEGKTFEVEASFHARRKSGEYKYHEVYVYLNKVDEFKDEFKAPKTLKQKWYKLDNGTWKGPRLAGYTEVLGSGNRCEYNLDEMVFVD